VGAQRDAGKSDFAKQDMMGFRPPAAMKICFWRNEPGNPLKRKGRAFETFIIFGRTRQGIENTEGLMGLMVEITRGAGRWERPFTA
jgi:hypothetical protein